MPCFGCLKKIWEEHFFVHVISKSQLYRVLFCFFNRSAIPVSESACEVREPLLDLGISHLQMKFCGKVFALSLFALYLENLSHKWFRS